MPSPYVGKSAPCFQTLMHHTSTDSYNFTPRLPQFQPMKVPDHLSDEIKDIFINIQKLLFEFAEQGQLLIQKDEFMQELRASLRRRKLVASTSPSLGSCVSDSNIPIHDIMRLAEDYGILQKTIRKFSHLKSLTFLSLHLEVISYECIGWVITSLREDEMTPTERSIQCRVKEAFALKVESSIWELAMSKLIGLKSTAKPLKLSSAQKDEIFYENQNYLFHNDDLDFDVNFSSQQKQTWTRFAVLKVEEDPQLNQLVNAIYFQGQKAWVGVDTDKNSTQIDSYHYFLFKEFLFNYFKLEKDYKNLT